MFGVLGLGFRVEGLVISLDPPSIYTLDMDHLPRSKGTRRVLEPVIMTVARLQV